MSAPHFKVGSKKRRVIDALRDHFKGMWRYDAKSRQWKGVRTTVGPLTVGRFVHLHGVFRPEYRTVPDGTPVYGLPGGFNMFNLPVPEDRREG